MFTEDEEPRIYRTWDQIFSCFWYLSIHEISLSLSLEGMDISVQNHMRLCMAGSIYSHFMDKIKSKEFTVIKSLET